MGRTRGRAAVCLFVALCSIARQAGAQAIPTALAAPSSDRDTAAHVANAWDALLRGAVAPSHGAEEKHPGRASDFLNHFYFETRSEYDRYSTHFTGNPSVTSIINAPVPPEIVPGLTPGFGYPAAFQDSTNRVSSFTDWGTRGWLSDRVNTHFSLRYRQELTSIYPGAAAADLLETFPGHRLLELTQANVEINARPTDGRLAGASLTVGRQYIYGAEVAAVDGAQFGIDRLRVHWTVFGGRRFTFYSDPFQRAAGGSNLLLKLNPDTSVEFDSLYYIKGSNSVRVSHRFGPDVLAAGYFRVYGGAPVDFHAQLFYGARNGRTSLRASFFQKLSNKDYFFDYTYFARDRDPHNTGRRLYLGPLSPSSQVSLDARRELTRRIRLAAAVWIKRLNSSRDQGPFDTSFTDYRISSQTFPLRRLETTLEYHQRNSDRLNPFTATTFDDIRAAGETSVKDLEANLRRSFGEGRFTLSGGAYYRRVGLQDRYLIIQSAHQSGWLSSASIRVDTRTRLFADYNLDNDFFVFRPDLANSRLLRLGVNWKY